MFVRQVNESSGSKTASQSCSDSENLQDQPSSSTDGEKSGDSHREMREVGKKSNQSTVCFLPAAEPQETRTVEFTKGPSDTLGISIAGGVGSPLGDIPIFIAMMNPVGLAAQTQKLKVPKSTRSASPGRGSAALSGLVATAPPCGWAGTISAANTNNATNCGTNIIKHADWHH